MPWGPPGSLNYTQRNIGIYNLSTIFPRLLSIVLYWFLSFSFSMILFLMPFLFDPNPSSILVILFSRPAISLLNLLSVQPLQCLLGSCKLHHLRSWVNYIFLPVTPVLTERLGGLCLVDSFISDSFIPRLAWGDIWTLVLWIGKDKVEMVRVFVGYGYFSSRVFIIKDISFTILAYHLYSLSNLLNCFFYGIILFTWFVYIFPSSMSALWGNGLFLNFFIFSS